MIKNSSMAKSSAEFPSLEKLLSSIGVSYYPIEKYVSTKDGGLSEYIKLKDELTAENGKLKDELKKEQKNNSSATSDTGSNGSSSTSSATLDEYTKLINELREESVNGKYNSTVKALNEYLNSAKESAQSEYSEKLSELEKKRKANEREVEYEYMKLMKYLPEYLESRGLSSLGVSQSAIINANDKKRNSLGELEDAYSTGRSDLEKKRSSSESSALKSYSEQLLSARNERDENLSKILLDNYTGKKDELDDISSAAYKAALNALTGDNSNFLSASSRKKYVESLKKYMSQNDWTKISMLFTD